jgi:hypothetical protein
MDQQQLTRVGGLMTATDWRVPRVQFSIHSLQQSAAARDPVLSVSQ